MESGKITRKVSIGGVGVGGGGRVAVQSMCTYKTSDVEKVVPQIEALRDAGCDIVRVSVLDAEDASAIRKIKDRVSVPIVADIHFSADLAVSAVENGCDKVRVNPGNIGGEREVRKVADCVRAHGIPVRVGANTGSIEKDFLDRYGRGEKALVESALSEAALFERAGVGDIVVSVKATSVPMTVRAYELLAGECDYPLHLGVTEAGVERSALVKSAAAFGSLLLDGIGDTIRVSMAGDPVREVYAAHDILRALEMESEFAEVISCPTCGRCMWDSAGLAEKVADRVKGVRKPLKIAVMGCVVNGPGETKECDIGIAGGDGYCLIYRHGEPLRKVASENAEVEFMKEIDSLANG